MATRQNNINVDIHELAKLFDSALNSKNPSVKSALQSFLTMAALAKAQEEGDWARSGPFESLFERIEGLEYKLEQLERMYVTTSNQKNYRDYTSVTSANHRMWYDDLKWQDLAKDYIKNKG